MTEKQEDLLVLILEKVATLIGFALVAYGVWMEGVIIPLQKAL